MKNRIQPIIQGLLWIITIVPVVYVMKYSISASFNGTYHGFNSDEKIYGFNAFVDVLLSFIAFEFIFLLYGLYAFLLLSYIRLGFIRNRGYGAEGDRLRFIYRMTRIARKNRVLLGEIADVIVRIDGVINRLENEISSLERELAAV